MLSDAPIAQPATRGDRSVTPRQPAELTGNAKGSPGSAGEQNLW